MASQTFHLILSRSLYTELPRALSPKLALIAPHRHPQRRSFTCQENCKLLSPACVLQPMNPDYIPAWSTKSSVLRETRTLGCSLKGLLCSLCVSLIGRDQFSQRLALAHTRWHYILRSTLRGRIVILTLKM